MEQTTEFLQNRHQDLVEACFRESIASGEYEEEELMRIVEKGVDFFLDSLCNQSPVESNILTDLVFKEMTDSGKKLSKGIRFLSSLRLAIRHFLFNKLPSEDIVLISDHLDKCIDSTIAELANKSSELRTQERDQIRAKDKQIKELKKNRIKFAVKTKRGRLDIAGTRMCLLDISGGWLNIGHSMMIFAGEDTYKRVFFEAGHSETFSRTALEKGHFDNTAKSFRELIDIYSESGFGNYIIRQLRFKDGFVRITCQDSFEGWAYLHHKKLSDSPVCYYSLGVLLSSMKNISKRDDLISVETKCIAKGDDKCEFFIGTEYELRKKEITSESWGMTIRERAIFLENLLEEKNRIEREIKKKNTELSVLNKISTTINQSHNLHEVLNRSINALSEVVGEKGIGIYLLERKKEELVYTAQRGFSEELYKNVSRLKFGEGLAGNVAQLRMPIAYDDYAKCPNAIEFVLKKEKIKSVLSVPLMAKDRIVGVLNVADKMPHHFSSDEINLITLIGNQIGVAIENAQLIEEIKESETKYKTLVEEINDGYFLCQDGRVLFTNNAFLSMHGYSRDEVPGLDFHEFISKEYVSYAEKTLEKIAEGEIVPELIEFRRHHRNGEKLPTELKINLVEYNGKSAMIGILSDISIRKKMEQELLENYRLASIGQLAADIAHEIRNPLSAIKTNIQVLSKSLKLQGFNKRRLEIASDEIMRLDRILADVMDFATPLKVKKTACDINKIIDKCLNLLGDRIKENNIRIIREVSDNTQNVPMDYEKMVQAILNVILNSMDAMPDGGRLKIGTAIDKVKSSGRKMLKIEILDSGVGIDSDHINRIFDPFFSTKTKGAGLGLPNVKKIIDIHHGIIKAENRDQEGTALLILIPAE